MQHVKIKPGRLAMLARIRDAEDEGTPLKEAQILEPGGHAPGNLRFLLNESLVTHDGQRRFILTQDGRAVLRGKPVEVDMIEVRDERPELDPRVIARFQNVSQRMPRKAVLEFFGIAEHLRVVRVSPGGERTVLQEGRR